MKKNLLILSLIGGLISVISDLSMWSFLGNFLSNTITDDKFLEVVDYQMKRLTERGFDTSPEALHRLKINALMLSALDVVALTGALLMLINKPIGFRLYLPAQVVYILLPLFVVGFHFNAIRFLNWGDPLIVLTFTIAIGYFQNKEKTV